MSKHRLLLSLVLGASLTVPASVAAQDEAEASAAPEPSLVADDTRLAELEALVPRFFAGLPLRENMQTALGEQLTSRLDVDERAVFEAMLAANDREVTDYAAANVPVRVDDSTVIVVQPHRVTGIDAAATLDSWSRILALNAEQPSIDTVIIAGSEVVRVSDEARPDFPLLHVFATDDVVWMVVSPDESVVEEAVRVFTATPASTDAAE